MSRPQLTDESVRYLEQWVQTDGMFTDYDLFWELECHEMCAVRLSGSGAIEENNNACELNINAVARSINWKRERKLIDECLKGVETTVCSQCNHHCFLSQWSLDSCGIDTNVGQSCPQGCKPKMISSEAYYNAGGA